MPEGDHICDRGNEAEDQRDFQTFFRDIAADFFKYHIGGDTGDKECSGCQRGVHGMEETGQGRGIEDGFCETGQFSPAVADDESGRRLLPGISDDYPESGDSRTDGAHQDREPVQAFGNFVPAENIKAEETGFQEEGENPFGCQGGAENVTDEF